MDYVESLRVFRSVVELKSFARASDVHGLAWPAVSRAISGLEERVGCRQLHRTTRHVSLTEAAERLYEGWVRILDDLDAPEADVGNQTREAGGVLRLVAYTTATMERLVPLIAEFKRAHGTLAAQHIRHNDAEIVSVGNQVDGAFGERHVQRDFRVGRSHWPNSARGSRTVVGRRDAWQSENNLLVSASWDLDLWGKNRERLRQAVSQERVAQAEAEGVRITLVASTYNRLALLYASRDVQKGVRRARIVGGTLLRMRLHDLFHRARGPRGGALVESGQPRQDESEQALAPLFERHFAKQAGPGRAIAIEHAETVDGGPGTAHQNNAGCSRRGPRREYAQSIRTRAAEWWTP